jgi:hypothetical protein
MPKASEHSHCRRRRHDSLGRSPRKSDAIYHERQRRGGMEMPVLLVLAFFAPGFQPSLVAI